MPDPQVDVRFPEEVVSLVRDCPFESLLDTWEAIISQHGIQGQRELCRIDRFYLLTHILGRVDAFHPWLYQRCREVEANPDGYLDLWAREHYKMVSVDLPVPTPSGWANHGDLKPGDWVFGPDGEVTRVVARTKVFTDGDAYEIEFSDGTKIKAGAEHLWTVERRSSRRISGTNKRLYRESVTLSTRDIAAHGHNADGRLSIPVNAPLSMPSALLPIPPYTLGAWLGDGSSRSPRLTCAYSDQQIVEEIRAEGIVAEERASSNENTGLYQLGDGVRGQKGTGIAPLLRDMGVLNNKHIPIYYLRGSISQRLALLQGLMDTDGHCNQRGTAIFTNKCEALVDGVFELAASLGLKPVKHAYEPAAGRYWKISFQAYQAMNPFRLTRKAKLAKKGARPNPRRYIVACRPIPPEPMSCIQVEREDGLYLIGKEMVTTHNSTIITFAGCIQEIIRDPEITICFFSHTKGISKKFFTQVKEELERNQRLKDVFPDIFWKEPKRDAVRWSDEKGLVVKRTSNAKEATVEAWGLVDGQPTSAHYRLRIYDDVVTKESVSTPDQVSKTTEAWELSDNLGARQENGMNGRAWHIGTRYHFADTYHDILERKALKPRIYAATEDGTPTGTPVFLSPEAWEEKKKTQGPARIACQMLQNPAAGTEAMFDKAHLKFIDIRPSTLNIYILCDPASSKKKGSDRTAMPVIAVDAQRNKYLIDGYHHKMNLQERWNALSGLRRYWMGQPGVQAVHVGYERYGMRSDIEYFEEKMLMSSDSFIIKELAWTKDDQNAKYDRIQRLYPEFSYGRFYLIEQNDRETSNQRRMRESGQAYRILKPVKRRDHEGNIYALNKGFLDEYLTYPFSVHDDMLDACSRIYDMDYQPPVIIDERHLEPEVFEDGI